MKKIISYLFLSLSIILIVVGGLLYKKDYSSKEYDENVINIDVDKMTFMNNNYTIDDTVSEQMEVIPEKLEKVLDIPNPKKFFFEKEVYGKKYYALKTLSNTDGMEHQSEHTKTGNCICFAYAYAQAMLYGKTTNKYADRKWCDSPAEFGLTLLNTKDAAKLAYKEIINGRPAVMYGKGCGNAGQHYFNVVGVTKSSFKKYVTNGRLNNRFKKASRSEIIKSLLVHDQWHVNQEIAYYNLGESMSNGKTCVWKVQDVIRYKIR